MQGEEIIQILIMALLAAFGALARLLSQKEKTSVKVASMISDCLVAAFSGVIASFTASYFNLKIDLMYAIAGISGWIGPQILDIIANAVLDRTGLRKN